MSTGLCALWAWFSLNRTFHPGSHWVTQVALISGAHPEHPISWCAASGLAREDGGYMVAQVPVDLTSLLLFHKGYITAWWKMFEEITLIDQCFLVFMTLGFCWKVLRWKLRNSLTPEYLIFMGHSHAVDVFVCVSTWVDVNYFLYQCLFGTLFQIMQGSNASWKSLILGLDSRCYSKDQL
jgi:hypothetical protein